MNMMVKEFAQQAYTTKDGKDLAIYPPSENETDGSGSEEEQPDGSIIKKKRDKNEKKKRKRGDKYNN